MYTVNYNDGEAKTQEFENPHEAKRWIDDLASNNNVKIENVLDEVGNVVSINPYYDDVWCGILLKKEEPSE